MTQNSFPKLTDDNNKVALVEGDDSYTYSKVNRRIDRFATGLLDGRDDLKEERIAFFMPASLDYVTAMHGIWLWMSEPWIEGMGRHEYRATY
jgi:malonyl-CoA/methylmalonyl-CoA synthetase